MDTQNRNYQVMIGQYRDGDNTAINPIIEECSGDLYKLFYLKFHHSEMAKDLVQEVFVRFVNAIHRGVQIENVKSWLYEVAKNLATDAIRKKYRRPLEISMSRRSKVDHNEQMDEYEDIPDQVSISPDDALLALIDLHNALQKCLCKFQPKVRGVLLAYLYGLNIRQISETLEMDQNQVNNTWTRSRMKLWNCMKLNLPEIGA